VSYEAVRACFYTLFLQIAKIAVALLPRQNRYRIWLISVKNMKLRGRPVILILAALRTLPVKKFAQSCIPLGPRAGRFSAFAQIRNFCTPRSRDTDVSPHTSKHRQVLKIALAMRGKELFSNHPAADYRRQ
jgi:hypothetical protein